MGSNISIVYATAQDFHICLKQVCPLYFENYVKPGQVVNRDVGKVWFTIEARLAFDKNEYSTGNSVLNGFLFSAAVITSLITRSAIATGGAGAIAASNNGGVIWSSNWSI